MLNIIKPVTGTRKNMKPIATEQHIFDNRSLTLSWFDSTLDYGIKVSQVSAYCIYDGKLVLVKNKRGWGIPGGHPEKDESAEETLRRELLEEACLTSEQYSSKIIGWMQVEDPANEGVEGREYIQLRYLAVLNKLPDFTPNNEIFERTLIDLGDFEKYISWGSRPTGKAQIMTLKKSLGEHDSVQVKALNNL